MKRRVAVMMAGFALDALLGDPHGWPHPVRLVGRQIAFEERLVRTHLLPAAQEAGETWPFNRTQTERLAGAAIVADVVGVATAASWAAIALADRIHPACGFAVEAFLCYQLLAARSLRDESMAVHARLAQGDIPGARRAVSMIVGRDTDSLEEQGITRAAVETVAENASDGVVAPLLYAGVGGVPAAMCYKAVNTLDSMMGYKDSRYLHLGWAAAKLDDAANFIPARVAGALMCLAAASTGFDARGAWRIFRRDRRNHASPNSAHTEAACAGALGVQLGGPSRYFGQPVEKPTIGDASRPLEPADIPRANRLMRATAMLALGASCLLAMLAGPETGRRHPCGGGALASACGSTGPRRGTRARFALGKGRIRP